MFTWLRPNDLVWNYVVNNYLLGKTPPAFDILFWNQDTVRLAAGLHRDFIHIGLDNSFAHPGALEVLGEPVDLGAVGLDTYFVAGVSDHIVPWESAYKGALLFGGNRRFVLSRSGHIQALVNPPARDGRSPGRATASPTICRPRPRSSPRARGHRKSPGAGGETGTHGWPSAPERSSRRPGDLATQTYKARGKAPGTYVLAN